MIRQETWHLLHDRFYRRVELSDLEWKKVDLSKNITAIAPYGGPIAIMRSDKKLFKLNSNYAKPYIFIYNSFGVLMKEIEWDETRIVKMGWTIDEILVTILENGQARIINLQGDLIKVALGTDASEYGIIDCKFWSHGCVFLTGNTKYYVISNFDDPKPVRIEQDTIGNLNSWTIIPPRQSLSGEVELILALDSTIYTLDKLNVRDQGLNNGPYIHCAASPNGKLIALWSMSGRFTVLTSDFQQVLADFKTQFTSPPLDFHWCGNDAVILHWKDVLFLLGPFGDWIEFKYKDNLAFCTEIDGIRIFSSKHCEFLQKVPESIEQIFKVGSTSVGAILYDAGHLKNKEPQIYDNMKSIDDHLEEAVQLCLDACGQQFDHEKQKKLLEAASLGKSFLDHYDSETFVMTAKNVRLLNQLIQKDIGMPLTMTQFEDLGIHSVLQRLCGRHLYFLALKMSEYFEMSKVPVLIDWAISKMKLSNQSQELIYKTIIQHLSIDADSMPFSELAQRAFQMDKKKLAVLLLDHEIRSGNQVPILIEMGESRLALQKAMESCDSDLVHLVMLQLQSQMSNSHFLKLIHDTPGLESAFKAYTRSKSHEDDALLWRSYLEQQDKHLQMAYFSLTEGLHGSFSTVTVSKPASVSTTTSANRQAEWIEGLRQAQKSYQQAGKDKYFDLKLVEESLKLNQIQSQLEKDTGFGFEGLTVNGVIYKLLMLGQQAKASKLKSEFKVPDRRFQWLMVRAFVQAHNWEALSQFQKSQSKFPVGNIIDILLSAGQLAQAKEYRQTFLNQGGLAKEPMKAAYFESVLSI